MKTLLLALCTFAAMNLAGCDKPASGTASQPAVSPANALTVLAGSELKDIEPLLPDIAKATGVTLQMRYSGTLDAVEQMQGGTPVDLAWLASNRYAMLMPDVKTRILASERTMVTPVVLGIRESKARELGWIDNPAVTWKEIAAAATAGKLTFGMTNPASSNTGFSGLLGLAAALSGKGDAIEAKDVDAKRLSAFFKAQRLTSGSSGWLAEAYVREQDKIDGIINYASTLLSLNRSGSLKENLVLIYPQDGILTADYPIMLVNPDKREAYDKLVRYLRGEEFQKAMAAATLRRPVNPDVVVADLPPQTLAELPFPAKLAVVDAILDAFDNHLRTPADSTYVVDVSGSMNGERLQTLKTSMQGLSGADATISGRFARFRNRERIHLLPFSSSFGDTERFDMGDDAKSNEKTMTALRERVAGLSAAGGTAIFSATQRAYMDAAKRRRVDPTRYYSIVPMTDGANNEGIDVRQFVEWYKRLPPEDQGIKIFPVVFGEANQNELQQLAALTGGRVFDSRKVSLQAIFKEIRGYQ